MFRMILKIIIISFKESNVCVMFFMKVYLEFFVSKKIKFIVVVMKNMINCFFQIICIRFDINVVFIEKMRLFEVIYYDWEE